MAKAKRERDAVNRMRVLHLTDLHSRPDDDFSERRDRIAEAVHEGSLDAIAVTGDLIQYTRNARQGAVALVRALNFVRDLKVLLGPECRDNVFVVPGNHDARFFPSKSGDGDDPVTKCTVQLDFETNSACIKDVNVESPEQKAFFDRVRRGL